MSKKPKLKGSVLLQLTKLRFRICMIILPLSSVLKISVSDPDPVGSVSFGRIRIRIRMRIRYGSG